MSADKKGYPDISGMSLKDRLYFFEAFMRKQPISDIRDLVIELIDDWKKHNEHW